MSDARSLPIQLAQPVRAATMRRVVVSAGSIDVVTADVPVPSSHQVRVRSVVAGVCGSDTHAAHGRHPFIKLPYHPGHEVVGVVDDVGAGVTGIRPGTRVTVEPDLPCWTCKPCRQGRQNLCEHLQFFGCGWEQGGMADYFTVAADRLHVIPDDLGYRAAALIEPVSTPVHAVRIAGEVSGCAVAVLGAGTIGLLVVQVLRAHGARRIVVTDLSPAKCARALRLGADAVVDPTAGDAVDRVRALLGGSADVVFDCVAAPQTMRQAIGMASKGGDVVIVGVPTGEVSIPMPILQDHEIRIQGSATYLPQDYAEAISLLQQGQIRVEEMVTAICPLEDAAGAFALSSGGEHVKVLIAVDPDAVLA